MHKPFSNFVKMLNKHLNTSVDSWEACAVLFGYFLRLERFSGGLQLPADVENPFICHFILPANNMNF